MLDLIEVFWGARMAILAPNEGPEGMPGVQADRLQALRWPFVVSWQEKAMIRVSPGLIGLKRFMLGLTP